MNRILLFLALALPLCAAEKPHDIVVYGGTSGGIIAAIQAAKSARTVILVSPTPYLGGLITSGLGWTDLGSDSILGGLRIRGVQNLRVEGNRFGAGDADVGRRIDIYDSANVQVNHE